MTTPRSPDRITPLDRGADAGAVLDRLETEGFAVIEEYLDPADVEAKRADLQRVLSSVPAGRNDFEGFRSQRIYALFAKTRTFDEQAVDPLVMTVVGRLLGPGFQLSAPVGINIGPGETPQPLHRDDGVYPIPRPHPEFVVNTMWALDSFTEDNGATIVAPGSHRWSGEIDTGQVRTVRATMPAGSLMIFRGSLIHGGGGNTTERPRLGVILEYCAGWLRPQENHVLGVPKAIVAGLPRPLQELLGYNVVGLLGNVDGRHPLKYLDDNRRLREQILDLSTVDE